MIMNYKLSDFFPKVMFWDVDMDKLSIKYDDDFIIIRVLAYHMNDIKHLESLEKLYSIPKIKHYAISGSIFGNNVIEFVAKRYDLNPSDFRKWIDISKLPS